MAHVYGWGCLRQGAVGVPPDRRRRKIHLRPGSAGFFPNVRKEDAYTQLAPAPLSGLINGRRITSIACGEQHSLALDEDGNVYAWGRRREGQCGGEVALAPRFSPERVAGLEKVYVAAVAAGAQHSLCITSAGQLYYWGQSYHFAHSTTAPYFGLGGRDGEEEEEEEAEEEAGAAAQPGQAVPQQNAPAPPQGRVAQQRVALENQSGTGGHGLTTWVHEMVDRSHYAYFANSDSLGALEDAAGDEYRPDDGNELRSVGGMRRMCDPVPQAIRVPPPRDRAGGDAQGVAILAAGGYAFTLIATEDGSVYSWGFNDRGQLGLGHRFSQDRPCRVRALQNQGVVQLSCGQQHAAAVTRDGHLWTWGCGVFGLGHGNYADRLEPCRIPRSAFGGLQCATVSCGSHHTAVICEDGSLWSFGHGEYGQHGIGDEEGHGAAAARNYASPKRVHQWADEGGAVSVACGALHTVVVMRSGGVYTFGCGEYGVLGHGDSRYRNPRPERVDLLRSLPIVAVAAGMQHTLALAKWGGHAASMVWNGCDAEAVMPSRASHESDECAAVRGFDLVLVVEGRCLYAHQAICAARCPRMRAMLAFNERFAESQTDGSVDRRHPDDDWPADARRPAVVLRLARRYAYAAVAVLVDYLYSDNLWVPQHLAEAVASLAGEFGLPQLRAAALRLMPRRTYAMRRGKSDGGEDSVAADILSSTFAQDMSSLLPPVDCAAASAGPLAACNGLLARTSDVVIDAGGDAIRAHAFILAARCPFFRAMVSGGHNLAQPTVRRITLASSQFAGRTVLRVLHYLYSGDRALFADAQDALDTLALADFLILPSLTQLCATTLVAYVDALESRAEQLDACARLLEHAEAYKALRLAAHCRTLLASGGAPAQE